MIDIMRLSLPLSLWIIGFSVLYALQGFSCSSYWPTDIDARPILIFAGVMAVAIQSVSLAVILKRPSPSYFVQQTALTLAATAIVAAIWTAIPILVTTTCL